MPDYAYRGSLEVSLLQLSSRDFSGKMSSPDFSTLNKSDKEFQAALIGSSAFSALPDFVRNGAIRWIKRAKPDSNLFPMSNPPLVPPPVVLVSAVASSASSAPTCRVSAVVAH